MRQRESPLKKRTRTPDKVLKRTGEEVGVSAASRKSIQVREPSTTKRGGSEKEQEQYLENTRRNYSTKKRRREGISPSPIFSWTLLGGTVGFKNFRNAQQIMWLIHLYKKEKKNGLNEKKGVVRRRLV